jgi:Protein of unknown function (DUF2971)
MWSHYADSHRGFVIGLDSEHEFFHRERQRPISSLLDVLYLDERPVVPRFEEIPANLHELVFLTKGKDWAYEEELRMFAKPAAADVVDRDVRGFEMYLVKMPPDAFTEIILGQQMSQRDKEELAIVAKINLPNIELYEAKLNDTRFDLDVVPYDPR